LAGDATNSHQSNLSAAVLAALEPSLGPIALSSSASSASGAGWSPANAEAVLALRLARANNQWSQYWQDIDKQAA
jgi:hypothetical protein